LLLRHSLGLESKAAAVEAAVSSAIERGVLTSDLAAGGAAPVSTEAAGSAVVAALRASAPWR